MRSSGPFFDQWGNGNLRAGADLLDPDVMLITLDDIPDGGRYVGRESVRQWIREFMGAWKDLTLSAAEVIEAGDPVVVAVHQEGLGKMSGARVERRYFQVWTFRGSAVVRIDYMPDRAAALAAAGLPED